MQAWVIVLLIVGVDQCLKALVQSQMAPAQSVPLIPHVVHLTYVQNTGAAFGLLRGSTGLLILVSLGVMIWAVAELRAPTTTSRSAQTILALIVGGAVGNLIDRVRVGYVIDFLDLRVWPVFNLADSAITIGVALLMLHTLQRKP